MNSQANPQAPVVPEDETFLTEDQLIDEYMKDRHGIEPEPEPEAQASDEGEPTPESDASPDDGQLLPGESSDRGEPEPEATNQPPEQPATPEEPEWMKELSEEARQYIASRDTELAGLRENYNAVHNRLAPVQQENARLRQRLADNTQRPAQTDSAPAPVGQSQPPAPFSLDSIEEFKEFREAFPDEAKAMEAAFAHQGQHISHLQQQLGSVSQGLQDMQQASFTQNREAELARLSSAHPDWATVRPSEDFGNWLKAQPPSIAQLADSPKADDCIWVLDRYKADAYMMQQFQQPQEPKPQAPHGNGRAQQTRTRRQQIRSVPSPEPQAPGVGNPEMGGAFQSEEELWEQEVERRLRAQREANR